MSYKLIKKPVIGHRYKILPGHKLEHNLCRVDAYDEKRYTVRVSVCGCWGQVTPVVVDGVPVASLDI